MSSTGDYSFAFWQDGEEPVAGRRVGHQHRVDTENASQNTNTYGAAELMQFCSGCRNARDGNSVEFEKGRMKLLHQNVQRDFDDKLFLKLEMFVA